MDPPRLSRRRLAFLIATPLAWAVLLLFHAGPDPNDLYGSLRDEVGRWQVVHLGTLGFIGLMGAALFALVKDLPGRAARISRLAIGPFVLFYGAGEAILGDNPISDDVLISIGGVAWVVATIAAAVAYRGVGAPMPAVVLLGLSSIVVVHAPPVGPVALVVFATAVILLARRQRVAAALD